MRVHQWLPPSTRKRIVLVVGLALVGALPLLAHEVGGAPKSAANPAKLEASIFSYDGHDFVRTKTTLMTKEGKSAVNTKLEQDTPAYKALAQKHSYSGEATVFGRKYEAHYAPLMGEDGRLTGALFVGVPK